MTFFALCKTTMAVTSFPSRQAPQLYQWELGSTSKSRQLKGFAFSVHTRLWKMDLFCATITIGYKRHLRSLFSIDHRQRTSRNENKRATFFSPNRTESLFPTSETIFLKRKLKKTGKTLGTPFWIFHENLNETKKLNEEASDWSNSVGRDSRWD